MLPLNALRRQHGTPYVTYLLLFANILVFIWELTLNPAALNDAFYNLALVPCQVGQVPITEIALDSLRSMFFHGGWMHLFGNMLSLVIFGVHVEEYYGSKKFLLFYIVAGYGSAILHTVFNMGVCIPVVGASGAIFGVMGAFLLLYPGVRIRALTFLGGVPVGIAKLHAVLYIGTFVFWNIIDGLLTLFDLPVSIYPGVAVWGHVGGFIAGLLFTFVATMFKPAPKVDPLAHLDD